MIMFFIFPILMFLRMLKASRSESLVFLFKGLFESKLKEEALGSSLDTVDVAFPGGIAPGLTKDIVSSSGINLGFLLALVGSKDSFS